MRNKFKLYRNLELSAPMFVKSTVFRYQRVNKLKTINPALKTLLAVGGATAGTSAMSSMLSSASNRQLFINSSMNFLRTRNFDGLDLDFEFPGSGSSSSSDKQLFTLLVQVVLSFRRYLDIFCTAHCNSN
jgi:GH18 family chitinase